MRKDLIYIGIGNNTNGHPELAQNYCMPPRFLMVSHYLIVVLQGIFYNLLFPLPWPRVEELYEL